MNPPLIALPNHTLGNVDIRLASPTDLTFIDALQRKHVNSTGFVPRTAIADHLDRHSYNLLRINTQPVGYAMQSGGIRKPLRLIQVAISEDAWRTKLGTLLILLALDRALDCIKRTMTATVRDGLPMNHVVTYTGAQVIRRDTTPTARHRDRIHYAWTWNKAYIPTITTKTK